MVVTPELKLAVWNKARIEENINPNLFRKDACGAWISWIQYGVKDNLYGWEIDHICPQKLLESLGYTDEEIWHIDNLRALQCQNNRSKSDDYPSYMAEVTALGNMNIEREAYLTVNEIAQKKIKKLYPKIEND